MPDFTSIIQQPFIQLIGRFHPMIVHLPIGFLIIAFIMEWVSYFNPDQKSYLKQSVPFILIMGFASGVVSILTGFLLSRSGSYELSAISNHQWAGITATLLTGLTYLFRSQKFYLPLFTVTILTVFISGHLGGELTHGKGFLMGRLNNQNSELASDIDLSEMAVFPHVISPILETNCQSCHNASKMNGELALDSYEAVLAGGVSGEILVKGNADASEMIRRVMLSEHEDDAMPPEGKKRLSSLEIDLLKIWVDSGLPNDMMISEVDPRLGLREIVQKIENRKRAMVTPNFPNVKAASPKNINQLVQAGFSVLPVAEGYAQLQVSYFNRQDTLSQKKLNLLKTVANQVVWLDISGANVLDWTFLSDMKNVVRLHLKNTSVSDDDLQHIKSEKLEILNLFNTNISNKSLPKFASLKKLKSLFIGGTDILKEEMSAFRINHPELRVDSGDEIESLLKEVALPMPSLDQNIIFIEKPTLLKLNSAIENVTYYYSFEGENSNVNWQKIDGDSIIIDSARDIYIYTRKEGWKPSPVLKHEVFYRPIPYTNVNLSPSPSKKYPGKGVVSVNDQKLGSDAYDDGTWLGYEGDHAEITLDLKSTVHVNRVSLNILHDSKYWIFSPSEITVLSSLDGKDYKEIGVKMLPSPQLKDENRKQAISIDIENEQARVLQVKVTNIGECPDWHTGKGKKAWLFFNEVIVE